MAAQRFVRPAKTADQIKAARGRVGFPEGFFDTWTELQREQWFERFLNDAWRNRPRTIRKETEHEKLLR